MTKLNLKLSLTFALLFALSGCAYFIAKIDTPLVKDSYKKNVSSIPTYCKGDVPTKLELISSDSSVQNSFYKLLQKADTQFDMIDHFVLWTLVQLYARPDQSSPTSRLQVILNVDGKTSYFDFFSELTKDQYPYFYGLDWILKKYGKKRSLEQYADILQAHLSQKLNVGKELAAYLLANKDAIKKDPTLAAFYYRGTEILQENETLPHYPMREILRHYRAHVKEQKIIINTALTPYNTSHGHLADCNYDFNLYDNSIFLIDKVIPNSNLFGATSGISSFMAASSQKTTGPVSLENMPLFAGESKVRSSALCMIETPQKKIWAFSNQSRDPGQHLFHLIRYGLPKSQSLSEVDRLLKHSRHLFLSDPVRLIIESNRSRPEQIENLLKLNLPIYNAENLGNIWAYTFFDNESHFVIDDRNNGHFLCK